MEQWTGGKMDLQMGQGCQTGVVGWKVRRRKMSGRRLCQSEGQAQESVDLPVRLG